MTSRTNYYKTVSQVFKFDEEHQQQHNNQVQAPSPSAVEEVVKKPETFYVDASDNEDDEEEENYSRQGNLPEVFGPPLWFSLHNASVYYPEIASPVYAERMKNIIVGLPVLIPCETCKEHATVYIEKNKHTLMDVCKSKEKLFKFFVDFHNYVNVRLGKREWSYQEAKAMYES